MRHTATKLTLACACACAITACGSSKAPTHRNAAYSRQFTAARCMRAHGVPNFPDPDKYGGNPVSGSPNTPGITIAGVTFGGPAFVRAEKLCNPLGLAGPRPAISEHQKEQLIGFAECMRHHGLTQWADPTFPPTGGVMSGSDPYSRSDPKVVAAAVTCNKAGG
jgi:hypothetical protein